MAEAAFEEGKVLLDRMALYDWKSGFPARRIAASPSVKIAILAS